MNTKEFDFDKWAELAKNDPEAFEEQRKAAIDKFLDGLPEQTRERMRRVQWRVDVERDRSKNPMDSAIRIYDMMWDSVSKTYDELQNLVGLLDPKSKYAKVPEPQPKAKVLPFNKHTGTSG